MTSTQPELGEGQAGNPRRALLLMMGLPVAAILVFTISLATVHASGRAAMLSLAVLTASIALIPVIIDQARPTTSRNLLLTLYCFLFIAHYALPIFVQYVGAVGPIDPPGVGGGALVPDDLVEGQIIALIGLVSLLIGYGVLPSRLSPLELERRKQRDWPPGALVVVAITMLALGWTIATAGALGMIPEAVGTGFIGTLGSSVIFGNALLTVSVIRHKSRISFLVLMIAVPVSMILGFFTGSKRNTLIVPAVIVLTSMLMGGRLRMRWFVAGALALAILYPTARFYREEVLQANTLTIVDALSDRDRTLGILSDFLSSTRGAEYLREGFEATSSRLDAIGIESVIVRDTPSRSPFQNGRTIGLFFAAFVPRTIWPTKPEITIGRWITEVYGSGPHINSSTGPSFIGDLYLNYGIPSVMFGMVVFGMVLRLVQTHFLGPDPTAAGILAAIVVIAQVLIKQVGPVAQTLSSVVFAFGPLLVAHLVVVYFMRRTTAGGEESQPSPYRDPYDPDPSARQS